MENQLASIMVKVKINKLNIEKYRDVVMLAKMLCELRDDKKNLKKFEGYEKEVTSILQLFDYRDKEAIVCYKGKKIKLEKLKYVLVKYESDAMKIAIDVLKSQGTMAFEISQPSISSEDIEKLKDLPDEIKDFLV